MTTELDEAGFEKLCEGLYPKDGGLPSDETLAKLAATTDGRVAIIVRTLDSLTDVVGHLTDDLRVMQAIVGAGAAKLFDLVSEDMAADLETIAKATRADG